MRKITILLICLLLAFGTSSGQYVNIPDSNFRNYLRTQYPLCFNTAGEMDTTCTAILSEDSLTVPRAAFIFDHTGLRYFKNLVYLCCDSNFLQVFEFPPLLRHFSCRYASVANNYLHQIPFPESLEYFDCEGCTMRTLPHLPNGLKYLNFANTYDTSVTSLPDSLEYLNCSYNTGVSTLPSLPVKIKSLFCGGTFLRSLPALPPLLYTLDCSFSRLASLPDLPPGLSYLNCGGTKIKNLPTLPAGLITLNCNSNDSLIALPDLPAGLITLNCGGAYNGQLTSLPELPASLVNLDCSHNKLSALPALPPYLKNFNCSNNLLTSLAAIPDSVLSPYFNDNLLTVFPAMSNSVFQVLCYNNLFTSIPAFPDSSQLIYCNGNQLTSLPPLPKRLYSLNCADNQLQYLPELPLQLGTLNCHHNNIHCLPPLPNNPYFLLSIDTGKIHCLPDMPSYLELSTGELSENGGPVFVSLPLCNPANNVSGCNSFPVISGRVFCDNNNNNLHDNNEPYKINVRAELSNGKYTYTDGNGYFEMNTDSTGDYSVTLTAPGHFTVLPSSTGYHFTSYDTIVSNEYALQANGAADDLSLTITPLNWAARPGFPFAYLVSYENVGTTVLSPNVDFNYDNTKLRYDSSSSMAVTNNGNTLSLAAGNSVPGQRGSFIGYFTVIATASMGSALSVTAGINANAASFADTNTVFIRGSFDPNDKQATPQLSPSQVASGKYIDYTIRFQNTGTDTAFNVVISDTLSEDLQTNTLQMITASHTCKTTVKDNVVFFEFLNILLPDSNVNELKSHGFVSFRIKPQTTVAANATITNKAAIYFDYNAPVITNTAGTLIKEFIVVPLRLVSFSAVPQTDNTTMLYWNTTNEINTKHFIIERSNDGLRFNAVTNVFAKGKANNDYSITVADADNSLVFYRLKMADYDGSFSYSPIIKNDRRKNAAGFSILNNPVKDFIIINTVDKNLNNSQASILNTQGVVIKTFVLKEGSQTIQVKDLPYAVYYLKTIIGSSRFLKQ